MTEVAALGLRVDGVADVERASRAMDGLSRSGAQAEAASDGLNSSTSRLSKSFGLLNTALAAVGIGSFTAALSGAISTSSRFSQAMAEVSAITRTTGTTLTEMTSLARELGATTEFSAEQAAGALKFLGMAGFDAAESMQALPRVLDLATASGMGLAGTADILSNVLSGFRLQASESSTVADTLAAAASRANTSVAQLGHAMSTVAPVSAALNISVQETAAAIGVLSDAGIQGERAGTALRGVLASIASPTTQAREALAGMGLSIRDIDPAANSLATILARLNAAGLSTADAMTIFGREAASGALAMTGAAARVAELAAELVEAEGAAGEMSATMRDTLQGDMKGLASAAQELAIAFAGSKEDSVRGAVQSLTGGVRALAENIKNIETIALSLAAVLGGRLAASFSAVAAAKLAATTQAIAYQAALARMAGLSAAAAASQTALAASVRGASAAFALIGGPVGAATLAALAVYQFKDAIFELMQGPLPDDNGALRKRIEDLQKLIEYEEGFGTSSSRARVAQYRAELDKLTKVLQLNIDLERDAANVAKEKQSAMDGLADTAKRLSEMNRLQIKDMGGVNEVMAENDDLLREITQAAADFDKAIRDVLESTYPYIRAARQHTEALNVMRRALDEGRVSGEQFNEWLRTAQNELLPEVTVSLQRVSTELPTIGKSAAETATTFTRGVERMRDAMGDFFQDLIVDGKASFSGLADLFKRMIAEMVATAAANRILVGVGMMSSTQAMASGGMLGQGGFSLSGIGTSISNFGAGAMNAIGGGASFLADMGLPGMNELSIRAYQQGMTMTTGAMLAGAGAGLLGGFAGNAVFGQTSGIGSTIGGGLGMAIGGPIGAGIGSFIGSGIESLFGSGKPSDKRQYAGIGLGGGELQTGGFSGDKFSQENLDTAVGLIGQFQAMADAIGGSNALVNVSVGGRTGVRYASGGSEDYREFEDAASLMDAAFRDILEGATGLAPAVKELALLFEGNAESAVDYTRALQSLWDATGRNGATAAATDYANAQRTLTEVYSASTANVRQLAVQFDGSAASVSALAGALGENQQLAYQLAMQFNQVRDSVSGMLGGLAESIRTSLMSQDELYAYQSRQVDALATALQGMTDPAQIMQTTQQFEQLVSGMWGRLSEEQRQEMGGGFLDTISDFEALAAQRIEAGSKAAEESQRVTGEIIQQGIRDAAAELQQSAASYQLSAQTIQQAAAMFMQAAQAQMRGMEVNA